MKMSQLDVYGNVVPVKPKHTEMLYVSAANIGAKIRELAAKKIKQAEMHNIMEAKKFEFVRAASIALGPDGKKLFPNEELRNGYAMEQVRLLKEYSDQRDLLNSIILLEKEIEAMDYEFKALRSIVDFEASLRG
jgi:hypothetical protein